MRCTGPAIGRAKSATYRTADVVGLDTMAHVIKTMDDTLPDDPWRRSTRRPSGSPALVAKGALGRRPRPASSPRRARTSWCSTVAKQDYRLERGDVADEVQAILKEKEPADQLAKLRASSHPQAQFLWAIFRDLFHYVAVHLGEVAHSARDVDFAIRWGFGWARGPFELWQAAGWQQVAKWIEETSRPGRPWRRRRSRRG
jgi:3-hydroxyacyl-CoA dehydrogenase